MRKYFYSIPTFTSSTWALLGISRFLLAFVVMISSGHLNKFTDVGLFLSVIREFGGKTAVMVFLMISGISVGRSIMKSNEGFIKRRFLRIYPLYFVAVLITVFLQYYLGSPYLVNGTNYVAAGLMTSISNFLLLQGLVSLTIIYNGALWSLSVEFFLYLILPLIFTMRLRYVYILALISLIIFITHTHFLSPHLYGVLHIIWAWPFIIGFLLAVRKQFFGIIPLILIGAFGIYHNYKMDYVQEPYSYLWFIVAFIVVVFFIYFKITLSKNIKVVFDYLGTISYPLYLFHYPFYFILYDLGIRESYLFVCLAILFSIPFNYIFDVWLRSVFWEPFIEKIELILNIFLGNRVVNKLEKMN